MQSFHNVLNLPECVKQNGTALASYVYLADGTKAEVYTGSNPSTGSGYSYLGSLRYTRTGNTRQLESTPFAAGRLVNNTGGMQPYYHITDHLGSIRVITDANGVVKEQNDYYPYGGRHTSGNIYALLPGNNHKFNGKEEQTTANIGYLDYGARMYDNVTGRWGTPDPLAEKYKSMSPYNYCLNNPVMFVDPDGREVDVSKMTDKNHIAAFTNFLRTKGGFTFISRYMPVSIGGRHYIFNEAGDRAKDVLWIRSSSSLNKGVIGRNTSYVKRGTRIINAAVNSDNVVKNGVHQVIDLAIGMDDKRSTATLGHEVFVHADESANMLTDVEKGNLREGNTIIKAIQNVGNKATDDHKRLGENTVIKYKNFMQELSRIFNDKYYNNEYEKDVKKYK